MFGPRYAEGWDSIVTALELYNAQNINATMTEYAMRLQQDAFEAARRSEGGDRGYFDGMAACAAVFLHNDEIPKRKQKHLDNGVKNK